MSQPRAIFLDFDNTLVDDDASVELSLRRACLHLTEHAPDLAHDSLVAAYVPLSQAFWSENPYIDEATIDVVRLKLWREALATCGCTDEALALVARDAYAVHRLTACEVYDDALAVVPELAKSYRLAVITNGDGEMQRGRLRIAGLDAYVELLVASTDVGSGKPEVAIFHQAMAKLGVEPHDVWHVGDRLDSDVQGAHNAGLTSVWLNRAGAARSPSQPHPHHEIASLHDLLQRLAFD
jgi:FMN hydrolase / 5-amino-6-(5-phospho-D-ribitylamino)uracil phosphatase